MRAFSDQGRQAGCFCHELIFAEGQCVVISCTSIEKRHPSISLKHAMSPKNICTVYTRLQTAITFLNLFYSHNLDYDFCAQ